MNNWDQKQQSKSGKRVKPAGTGIRITNTRRYLFSFVFGFSLLPNDPMEDATCSVCACLYLPALHNQEEKKQKKTVFPS